MHQTTKHLSKNLAQYRYYFNTNASYTRLILHQTTTRKKNNKLLWLQRYLQFTVVKIKTIIIKLASNRAISKT